nr:E3 ubiquitin-protein ligase TRIM39-like isoform X1 [Paramormyrops kingsleyae]XP_023680470.1 E3 ubiquitin-protein ligase TRIM39-like isoform X1 [Paramormyrops kingsleyae]
MELTNLKGIRKERSVKFDTSQSASIGAVRWTLPEEDTQAHSSAPTTFKNNSASRANGLRNLRSLQDCVKFINQWKEQVDQLCKQGGAVAESTSRAAQADPGTTHSLEECRRLILQWAKELKQVDMMISPCSEEDEEEGKEKQESSKEKVAPLQQRIMEWAKELQTVSENCGIPQEELAKLLRHLEVRKRRLMSVLPFLEFITWCLLKEDSKASIPNLWLLTKQRTWKVGTRNYIPNSVWSWICSAAEEVTLDPMTNHPWLQLSDDRKRVQEGLSAAELPFSTQRFDGWPCVLGWEGFSYGRHYWEVDLANNGYWRLGLTTGSSKRNGRFPMVPSAGFWTLWKSTRQFYACTAPETPLPPDMAPRRIGVYLDYEEGQISFYNASAKSHIYTFIDTFRETLYPLFAPLDGRTLITVSCPTATGDP